MRFRACALRKRACIYKQIFYSGGHVLGIKNFIFKLFKKWVPFFTYLLHNFIDLIAVLQENDKLFFKTKDILAVSRIG